MTTARKLVSWPGSTGDRGRGHVRDLFLHGIQSGAREL
jgi:hypothetical protein